MAEVATARSKRGRSPSPSYADTLASPLEVLLKRRRRTTWTASAIPSAWDEEAEMPAASSSSHEMSSPLARGVAADYAYDSEQNRAGVERQRSRRWERLQAPQLSRSTSRPPLAVDLSPSTQHRRAMSQPQPLGENSASLPTFTQLSSSPVRHQPPSSTPFRGDDEWAPEERMQEWGDEYATQNSLLHSLHMARAEQHSERGMAYSPNSVTGTPHHTPGPSDNFLNPNRTPNLPTPYRHRNRTPLDTPGLVSSPGFSSPQYSPFPSAPHASPIFFSQEQQHVRASYEEANRMLAELNVQRLRRQSTDDGWMDES